MESLSGMKIIHLAAAEPLMTRVFGETLGEFILQQRKRAVVVASSSPFLTGSAGVFIAMLLLAKAVMNGGESTEWVAPFLMFLFLMFRLLNPVTQINAVRLRIVGEIPSFDRLDNFFAETAARRQKEGSRILERLQTDIVLDHLSFAYKPGDDRVIHDLSTTIRRGEMVAVVGPSGAGKTTLIGLLARLYDPSEGRILVDGHDLRDLQLASWRRRLAVVSQDIFIFNDTVAANIAFGRGEVPLDRIRDAARLAAADEFIEKLPQGYATMLGDRGNRLSGGHQQRIALARAVLADPDLLIMDEATSHLDSFTERAIQQAVETLSKDRTLLVIAHRLSTIRKADRVIVMKDGRIVEEGRHEDLLRQRGLYWEMIEQQDLGLVDED
jgi:ABC-type multidrug transport system fused ATPase/permease subunit